MWRYETRIVGEPGHWLWSVQAHSADSDWAPIIAQGTRRSRIGARLAALLWIRWSVRS